ncbi:hypothetical protein EJB05_54553, partial [Eragrostis curvula]
WRRRRSVEEDKEQCHGVEEDKERGVTRSNEMALSVTSLPIACVVASTRSLCGCMHDESLFEFLPQGCLTL